MNRAFSLILFVVVTFLCSCSKGDDMTDDLVWRFIDIQRDYLLTVMGHDSIMYDDNHQISGYVWDGIHYQKKTFANMNYQYYDAIGTVKCLFSTEGFLKKIHISSSREKDGYRENGESVIEISYDSLGQWLGNVRTDVEHWNNMGWFNIYKGSSESSSLVTCVWNNHNLQKVESKTHFIDNDEGEWDEVKIIELTYGKSVNPKRIWPYSLLKKLKMEYPALGYMGKGPQNLPTSITITEKDITNGECGYYNKESQMLSYLMNGEFISCEIIDNDSIFYQYQPIDSSAVK